MAAFQMLQERLALMPYLPHSTAKFAYFIQAGNLIDFDGVVCRAYEGKTLPNEMAEVPAEAWITSSWLREDAVVSEQSMPRLPLSLIWARR